MLAKDAPKDTASVTPVASSTPSLGFVDGAGAKQYPKVSFKPPVTLQSGVKMYAPQNPIRRDGTVDIIIQFRGVVPKAFEQGGVNAVVLTAETDGLSDEMMEKFGQKGFVPRMIETAMAKVRQQYPEAKAGRLALGSFSAGYAPLQVALSNPDVRQRADTVVVLDGIHYGGPGKPSPAAHKPFVEFAQAAAAGDKLMLISHSSIKPTYSSSTDAANYIATQVGAERKPDSAGVPDWSYPSRYGTVISPSTRADKGDFHVEGHAGEVANSHMEQLDNLGNLWNRYLAPRWE
ncbi:MAG TPA: hypothetical protein V6D23_02965 [Candidatus Obscuribacterales bacterium]